MSRQTAAPSSPESVKTSPRCTGLIIFSGGQTGVDRAALDVAQDLGLAVSGWCPAGGKAEDFSQAPGLLGIYPQLAPTPGEHYRQRTEWNVRDSQGTMIVTFSAQELKNSPGTVIAREAAQRYRRPTVTISLRAPGSQWLANIFLASLGPSARINIAGPRESQAPGIYQATKAWLPQVLGRRY